MDWSKTSRWRETQRRPHRRKKRNGKAGLPRSWRRDDARDERSDRSDGLQCPDDVQIEKLISRPQREACATHEDAGPAMGESSVWRRNGAMWQRAAGSGYYWQELSKKIHTAGDRRWGWSDDCDWCEDPDVDRRGGGCNGETTQKAPFEWGTQLVTRLDSNADGSARKDDDRPPVSSIVKPSQDGTAEPVDSCPIHWKSTRQCGTTGSTSFTESTWKKCWDSKWPCWRSNVKCGNFMIQDPQSLTLAGQGYCAKHCGTAGGGHDVAGAAGAAAACRVTRGLSLRTCRCSATRRKRTITGAGGAPGDGDDPLTCQLALDQVHGRTGVD